MMVLMTTQPPLPIAPLSGATSIGAAVSLVENDEGGKVFIHGELAYVWDVGDAATRRFAAASLVDAKAAVAAEIAAAFGVEAMTLWRWRKQLTTEGVTGLVAEQRGPKGPSRLRDEMITQIVALRESGLSLQAIADTVGVSDFSVRRALAITKEQAATTAQAAVTAATAASATEGQVQGSAPVSTGPIPVQVTVQPDLWQEEAAGLPVLPAPVERRSERGAARAGQLTCAAPIFAPAARVPHAGLFLAFPALEHAGLLRCAETVYGSLPNGFYGLETILIDSVLRALVGEARAEGSTRFTPEDLGRVLGMDRAPEVKTIRRRINQLAHTGKAAELMAALGSHHLGNAGPGGENLAAILYVDGHVRAYQGTKRIGKLYSTRLKFPVPATEETWVADANGSPVFLVMAEPGASLAGELRRLLPELRAAIGDDRRVLVGFDRGGWSPTLFKHMKEQGFDVLTWSKGKTGDIDEDLFTNVTHRDEHGQTRTWHAADTLLDLPLTTTKKTGEVFQIRAISQIVPNTKGGGTRQIHILTTDHTLTAGEAVYRMGNRWRQENQFRYARMHFDLDSHDCYTSADDNPERMVPHPAKTKAYQKVVAARKHHADVAAQVDAGELLLKTPPPGTHEIVITNQMINELKAPLWVAETALDQAEAAHQDLPARVRLGALNPGQQVLETETKLIHHSIRMAAFNTMMTLAREVRTNTGYKRGKDEAHALIRQALHQPGDIDPTIPGYLTITLDPLPTQAKTAAIAELCQHLTNTKTLYPGTNLTLRYTIKKKTPTNKN